MSVLEAMGMKFYSLISSFMLLLFLCCATVLAQLTPLDREPSRPRLVDQRPGYRPLYQSSDETKRRNGSYIIKLKDTIGYDDLGRIMGRLTDQDQNPNDDAVVQGLSGYSMVGLGVMATLNQKALDSVRQDNSVDYVEEDQIVEISVDESWHTDRVDQTNLPLNQRYCPPNEGEGADIYILDTGINYCHKDFCLNRAKYAGYSPVVSAGNLNANGQDCNGHGTHVAALCGGNIHGIARKARIYSLPVVDCQGRGSNINIILALNYVAQRASANPERKTIISMSLIAPLSQAVNEAVARISQLDELPQGILVVTAAGNFKRDACQYSPGSSRSAVTVGGTARNDFLYWGSTSGTNFGRCVDIFAPGEEVTSASYPSCAGETIMSGTSMATPIVSGAAAIIWTANMSLTQAQVKEKLIAQSTKDVLDFSQLVPSQRRVTPNRLVNTGRKGRCRKTKLIDYCASDDSTKLCGKPWECPVTTLITSVNANKLKKTIEEYWSNKMIPSYISPYVKGRRNKLFFAIIFKPVDRISRDYRIAFDLNTADMEREIEEQNGKRFYEIYAASYNQKGEILHIVVFQKMKTPPASNFYLAQSKAQYEMNANLRTNRRSCVKSLAITQDAQGSLNYTTLYKNCDDKTAVFCGLNFKNLLKRVNRQRNKGFTLKSISTYTVDDETQFCAVFTNEKVGECEYTFVHSFSENEIRDIAESHKNDGYRIVAIVVHSQTSFPLFMAVFKK